MLGVMISPLGWGILGTGSIARAFAHGVQTSLHGCLKAVASRDGERAGEFASRYSIPRWHGSYEALLADPAVEAVYVAVPHPWHAEWSIKAAEAGKHILCEKPLGLNRWQAATIFEAGRRNNVLVMEAFMYRCHPQIAQVRRWLAEKAIGEVRMIQAEFAFGGGTGPVDDQSRLYNNALGGGGILDVGCYPVSLARLVAGEALGRRFADPLEVKAVGHLGATGVDEYAAALLRFEGGIVAQVATGVRLTLRNEAWIFGSDGWIHIPHPWVPLGREGVGQIPLHLHRHGQTETVECGSEVTLYGLEADAVAEALPNRQVPAMSWDDSLGNMATLDKWRGEIGLVYEAEKPLPQKVDVAGRPVSPRSGHNMKFGVIPGVAKPVSKFILGALISNGSYAKAQVLFDQWVESGGNTFDTGHSYGSCDRIFGQWMQSRGLRDDLVVIAKGVHPPENRPEFISPQLDRILEHFGTDFVDIYIMHRDNEAVPVGEWMEALDREVKRGRLRVLGGSNWSLARFLEANAWARDHGCQELTILNNNLALAEMVDPVWGGCRHVSDPESRAQMQQHQIVHLSWSSTARGFFTDRFDPDRRENAELVRCWYSERNFQVKARAEELARRKNCAPINIAAAWVLHQPFPSFALIGPENPTEMNTQLPALDVELTPDEVSWLAMDGEANNG